MPPSTQHGSSGADASVTGSRKRSFDATSNNVASSTGVQGMDATFITIHDLTPNSHILYCSQSITDVLEWMPDEVVGKPCWDFFHPDEVVLAKNVHSRGVQLDRASVLNYCRIKRRNGDWVGCECVFTIVYNVLIGCTSVYLDGPKAKKRAVEAPVVRQLFSSSPRDPRYHMLSYISAKFRMGPQPHLREPRAALFLNRFTRTLTINYATNGLEDLLGIPADELQGQSFYYCIQENCLAEAIRCLESAKANDSIAYLRFWYRDPRTETNVQHEGIISNDPASSTLIEEKEDSLIGDDSSDDSSHEGSEVVGEDDDDEDSEEGGVRLTPSIQVDDSPVVVEEDEETALRDSSSNNDAGCERKPFLDPHESRHSSDQTATTETGGETANSSTGRSSGERSSTPRTAMSLDSPPVQLSQQPNGTVAPPSLHTNARRSSDAIMDDTPSNSNRGREVELEAVISCTSDGLVVVIRAARPFEPASIRPPSSLPASSQHNGLFASPWAIQPVMPDSSKTLPPVFADTYAAAVPSLQPRVVDTKPPDAGTSGGGPPLVDFMNSIREVAVFAWALTGINGSLQQYGTGRPLVGAIPHSGLPVWEPDSTTPETKAGHMKTKQSNKVDGEEQQALVDGSFVDETAPKGVTTLNGYKRDAIPVDARPVGPSFDSTTQIDRGIKERSDRTHFGGNVSKDLSNTQREG